MIQKKENQIVFNHLVPIKQELQGLHEYYVPDGSFDAYIYKDGKWIYTADVDARNDFTEKKAKKPKMGLTPR